MKAVKKPIPVEVVQWTESDESMIEVVKLGASISFRSTGSGCIYIETLEGVMRANPSDYIIKGPFGEFWPVKKEIFEATYTVIEE